MRSSAARPLHGRTSGFSKKHAKNRMCPPSTDPVSPTSSRSHIPRSSHSPPTSPPPLSAPPPLSPPPLSPPQSAVMTTSREILPLTPAIRRLDLSPVLPQRKSKGRSKVKPLPATAPPKVTRKSKK